MDLWQEIQHTRRLLAKGISEMKERGQALAKAERDYKIKQSEKILKLKAENFPATLIRDVVKGDKEVATLRFERDIADSSYETCREAINVYKRDLTVLENQFQREWGGNK